jgi:hypothetical protein
MPERRGTMTDKLSNVIQVLQLGKKTGTLFVERGEGTQREEGTISFIQGQITHASAGQRTSQASLIWLGTWTTCRFTFVPADTGHPERLTGPLVALPRTPSQPGTGTLRAEHPTSPRIQTSSHNLPAMLTHAPAVDSGGIPRRTRPPEEALALLDRAELSRVHRHLLLLIDGHRSIAELVRLTGRKPDEVIKFLRDLEQIGVVQV